MDSKIIRKFKWFWLWQDVKQENWLHRMSLDGLHLKTPGFFVFNFEEGPSQDFIYLLDFFNKSKMSILENTSDKRREYMGIFEDAGWEHLGQLNGWQYFRIIGPSEESQDISVEVDSKIENFRRLLRNLMLTSPVILVVFLGRLEIYPAWFAIILVSVFAGGLLFSGVSGFMIASRLRKLNNN